ncbi:LysM domain-containing protein [Colletotrichum orchidophilum]|uniref:LysM domain-containing protein n=1 Tax=Colletotrichum orchidophilum TaxID=1209926 RepID=A0A1G4B0G4_9PEZI|nr:LysM domain-containing protein [Colletotrichum orchidophilum]OHE94792.1 LysM domain-containing protein [Colletotrichum orchidophilum]
MQITHFIAAAGVLPAIVSAKAALSRRAVDCAFSTAASKGDTCSTFASSWGLSVDELQNLNPGITCPTLDTSNSYCVIGTITDDPEPTTTTAQSTTLVTSTTSKAPTTTTTTTTAAAAPSNSPAMPGLAANCDGFYKVSSGDSCDAIASKYSISTAQFKSWNTEVNADCTNLWLDYYVCVHVPGAATTTQAPTQPTTPPSTGPTPQMPGIVSNCKKYYQVNSGDSCWSIYSGAGITFEQFLSYNTQVDSTCSNLWLGYYVCTGV